jgi:hypothetical protein
MPRLAQAAAALALLLTGPGCGGEADAKRAAVQGQVFYKGRPLAGGTIVFAPDPGHGARGPLAWGQIGPDGRYTLRTGDEPGAVVGWHRVTVAAPGPAALPARYSDPERSGQVHEVHDAPSNTIDVRLE